MKRDHAATILLSSLLLAGGCATAGGVDPAPAPSPVVAAPEAHLEELQRSVTELADRLEVMSDRMQRLESAADAPARTVTSAPVVLERSLPEAAPAVHNTPQRTAPPPAPQTVMTPSRSSAARSLGGPAMEDKYRRALTLYGQGKTAEARRAFQDVFDSDPTGELADNALYWLGETFFAAGNYTSALTYYQRVVKDYSDQNKAPDALFKSGMAYEKMGDLQLAKRAFDDCVARYPYSTPAASARIELKRIKY